MKKILVIQSRTRPEMLQAEQGEYTRAVSGKAELTFISSLDETQSWEAPARILAGFDACVLGGSGEFDFDGGRADDDVARLTSQAIVVRLKPFIEYVLQTSFPTLGICYGHQIIAEIIGVPVINDLAQKKTGTYEVFLTDAGKEDVLFGEVPEHFMAQYGHKDSLSELPSSAVLLASSPQCKTSAVRYGSKVYTMQFHPELTDQDVRWKLENSPGYLPEGTDIDSIIKPSPEASLIIPRFVEKIVTSA